ncbi:MAG TPA: putative DNA modification/repair radical SAM protein [Bryobacteraceae bacterium]|nr:putative DNA modification/repair radical SAM protein [Bryobacteraceae bacterium]
MDLSAKLRVLSDAAKYDAACASSESVRKRVPGGLGNAAPGGICHSFTPDGRCVSLLKILLTNYCIYDCLYCVNRISSDTPRARFTISEIVNLTLDFYKRNYIEGLFLSSGIIQSPDYTMEQLVAVARELRTTHKFCGYIHLKGVPGAARELLIEAGRYADRLSVNIELSSQRDLDRLAPAKNHEVIQKSIAHIRNGELTAAENKSTKRDRPVFAQAGQTTQMVIGATPAPDAEILTKASELYGIHRLRRIYYSAFSPIPHAAAELPVHTAPLVREHRLYQADWLMRFYGFGAEELTTATHQNLSLDIDPKLAWALRTRHFFPVDVNTDSKERLLRVPGLGARTVERILHIRRFHRLTGEDLVKLRIPMQHAEPFVVAADLHPLDLDRTDLERRLIRASKQMPLFAYQKEPSRAALSGEF